MFTKKKLAEQNQSAVSQEYDLPFPHALKQIILDYCDKREYGNNHLDQAELKANYPFYPYKNELSFFGNLKSQIQVAQAAYHVLRANPQAALALIKQNPSIVHSVVVAQDPYGNKVKGTPLQLAMMTGDFNFRDMEEKEEDHGLAEQLSAGLDKEVIIAQRQAVFPQGWENEMEERMRPIRAAFYKFAKIMENASWADIQNMQRQRRDNIIPESVREFRAALIPDPKKIITSGYIVDHEILVEAYAYLEKKVSRFGGLHSSKSDLYFVYGIGSLQRFRLSICDRQVIRSGLHYAIKDKDKIKVKRDPVSQDGNLKASLDDVGFYINIYGGHTISGCASGARTVHRVRELYQSLGQAKTAALQDLCGESMPKSRSKQKCLIL